MSGGGVCSPIFNYFLDIFFFFSNNYTVNYIFFLYINIMLMSHLLLDYLVFYLLFIFIFYVSCSILITYLKQHVNWIFCFLSQIFLSTQTYIFF